MSSATSPVRDGSSRLPSRRAGVTLWEGGKRRSGERFQRTPGTTTTQGAGGRGGGPWLRQAHGGRLIEKTRPIQAFIEGVERAAGGPSFLGWVRSPTG